jgi:prolyl-tRNA synthetase
MWKRHLELWADPIGEDWIVTCSTCDYRANLERATSRVEAVSDPDTVPDTERFATPDIRTIAALAEAFPDVAAPDRQIKTLVYIIDGTFTLVMMRGDHALQEQKLQDVTGGIDIRPAQADEILEQLGALPGSLGAVGVTSHPIIADQALAGRRGMVTGANEDDWHLRNVDVERDIAVGRWVELREVSAGESCTVDGGVLELWKGIEVGHIFKLGTKYSEAMGAIVQDEKGDSRPIIMGSYGIGLERSMAAIVEASHDDAGIVWPWEVAPYHVIVTLLRQQDEAVVAAGDRIYAELTAAGYEVLLDDRDERPGVKFADAELIGVPYRVTIGPRGLESGVAEFTTRATMETIEIPLDAVGDHLP